MTDIFHEIQEEVRRERYEKIWKDYGDYIIAAAAFLIIAAAGWQIWRYYEHRQEVKSSAEYLAAQNLLESGQVPAAAEAFGKLAASAPGGYAEVARLQEAGALQQAGRTADAVKLYSEVMANGDGILVNVARLRAAWATVDTSSHADLQKLLSPLMGTPNPWKPMAQEILAYSDFHSGKTAEALTAYKKLAAEKNLPESLHQRSAAMAVYLAAGAGQDFGTVPPPAPAPKAPAAKAAASAPSPAQGSKTK